MNVRVIIPAVAALLALSALAASRAKDAPATAAPPADSKRIELSAESLRLPAGQSHQLRVSASEGDGFLGDATGRAAFTSDDSAIASVDAVGVVTARAAGSTHVKATIGDRSASIAVTVVASSDEPPSFVHDVLPVLSKAGCNAGGCHAKPEGQNGFKLSIFSFDPQADYRAIVEGDRGRRIFPAAPEESLLLRKPTLAVEHGGGQRIDPGSARYRLLTDWIASGMTYSHPDEMPLVGISVYPADRRYRKDATQPLVVTARYADGVMRDVTALADFGSTEPEVARVDTEGRVTIGKTTGAAVITARFMGEVAVSRVTVPSDRQLPDSLYAALPSNNFIDDAVYARLKELGLAPSELCSDEEFIRRASLDAIGVLPTPDEVRAFLADERKDKRARLVDALLERPAYADYWATKWGDLLRPNTQRVGIKPVYLIDRWIRESLRTNMPHDQFVREILTAQGSTHENGPVVLFRDRREPADLTTFVSQVFMGVRLECAKCHHHPNERWGQNDFYQLAAFFAPLKRKGQGISAPISGEAEYIRFAPGSGTVKHPLTGETMKPKPPGGAELTIGEDQDPREAFVDWLTSADNPFFARAAVNRVWGELMGRGIVHPVDDLRETNPPSNERLLDALAKDFVAHRFDRKHLIRTILNSRTYQLSSLPNDTNVADTRNFSRSYRRRLPAEVMLDAVTDLTGVPETFDGVPPGSRAVRVWNNKLDSSFLDAFGRPDSSADCPCERDRGTSVVQSLHLMHSTKLQAKIANPDGRAAKLAKSDRTPEQIVEELYLAAYSRRPDADELKIALEAFTAKDATRQKATEDVVWALINSAEFVFNH
jgi:hypothetical protein